MTQSPSKKEHPNPLKVYIAPHWHFDHAWLYTHDQYMDELVLPNFRVLRTILRKYPMYRCIVEQATMWETLRVKDPRLFEELHAHVKSGRIALVGGQITSPDIQLPSGESQLRNYFYGRRFLQETFGKDTNIAWNIDTFGHHAQYPAILNHMGMKYYVFHRGVDDKAFRAKLRQENKAQPQALLDSRDDTVPGHVVFHWKALNGKDEVLAFYQTNTYMNFVIDPIQLYNESYFIDVFWHQQFLKKLVDAVVHVGVTYWFGVKPVIRKIVAAALFFRMNVAPFVKVIPPPRSMLTTLGSDFTSPSSFILHLWPFLRKIGQRRGIEWEFGTPQRFFADCEQIRAIVPSYQGNFFAHHRLFSGVWSSRMKIKQASRACERLLYEAEVVGTLRFLLQQKHNLKPEYPFEEIDALWKDLLVNQFHDVIYGCGIDLVYVQSLRALANVQLAARDLLHRLVHGIAEMIALASSSTRGSTQGGEKLMLLVNPLLNAQSAMVGKLVVEKVPGLGYEVVPFPETDSKEGLQVLVTPQVLDTTCDRQFGQFKLSFDHYRLIKIVDAQLNKVLLESRGPNWVGGIRALVEEGDAYDSVARRVREIWQPVRVILEQDTKNLTKIIIEGSIDEGNAVVRETISIEHATHTIKIDVDLENAIEDAKFELCLPHAPELTEAIASIPFGSRANPKGLLGVQDWMCFQNEEYGIIVVNSGTPEHLYYKPNLYITLLRAFDHIGHVKLPIPRKTPMGREVGEYHFSFAIRAFSATDQETNPERIAAEILHPCLEYPLEASVVEKDRIWNLLLIPRNNASLAALKVAHPPSSNPRDAPKDIILRLFNPLGASQEKFSIQFSRIIECAIEVNGMELEEGGREVHDPLKLGSMFLDLGPFTLKTIRISFKEGEIEKN